MIEIETDVCRNMMYVAIWRMSQCYVCNNMMFVAIWCMSQYDVCCNMMYVAIWCMSQYEVCCNIMCVTILCMSQNDVCCNMIHVAIGSMTIMYEHSTLSLLCSGYSFSHALPLPQVAEQSTKQSTLSSAWHILWSEISRYMTQTMHVIVTRTSALPHSQDKFVRRLTVR
jgi:hypothetical protein